MAGSLGAAALVLASVLVTDVPAGAAQSASLHHACQAITDVLADGPDGTADPVGHAEAQILPLTQLKISDGALKAAVKNLDKAYAAEYAAGGTKSSKKAADAALKKLDKICPGVGQ